MVCWGPDSEWGGKILQVGNGEEGKEWGSIESGPIEYLMRLGIAMRFWYIWVSWILQRRSKWDMGVSGFAIRTPSGMAPDIVCMSFEY